MNSLNERRASNEILMSNRQAQMSEVGKYSVTVRGYDVFVDALRYRYHMNSWESESSFKRIGQTPDTSPSCECREMTLFVTCEDSGGAEDIA